MKAPTIKQQIPSTLSPQVHFRNDPKLHNNSNGSPKKSSEESASSMEKADKFDPSNSAVPKMNANSHKVIAQKNLSLIVEEQK